MQYVFFTYLIKLTSHDLWFHHPVPCHAPWILIFAAFLSNWSVIRYGISAAISSVLLGYLGKLLEARRLSSICHIIKTVVTHRIIKRLILQSKSKFFVLSTATILNKLRNGQIAHFLWRNNRWAIAWACICFLKLGLADQSMSLEKDIIGHEKAIAHGWVSCRWFVFKHHSLLKTGCQWFRCKTALEAWFLLTKEL